MEGKTMFVEIQKQVGAAHFVLPVEAVKDSKSLPVVVHPDKVAVQSGKGESVYRFPDGFRVRPKSCSGLKWLEGDGLHLRLSVVEEEAEEQKEKEEDGRGEENGPDIKPGHTRMCCAMCGHQLLKPSFCAKRVLPLPSDGWQEAVAHSFCHKSQDTQNMAAQTLAPRPADILTGTGHVLVHAKAIHSDNVDVVDSEDKMVLVPLVRCKRCRSQVGIGVTTGKKKTPAQATPEPPCAIKLYLSNITVHEEGSTCSPVTPGHASPGQDSVLAQQLLKESESQYCLRFVVQDLRADVYLLMWLLKSETRLMTISTQGSVSSRDILKILYLPLPRDGVNKLLLESWKKDENVGLLSYPRDTCLHLVSHLVSHTQSLPVSLRSMNNFMVGFLTLKNNPESKTT
ncbi:PREDICTED: E3 ubiquitin-protein ligase E3D-like [Branchiostoma belcheri]|uniref:E3 ubiquitin-protein ligase E3D n=1 Tax=Branchiostoma belcheri TaxID=7741 RepID=A0A6P4ZCT6_BRABE|nr:PREDICTED: E3 ubiquitin-protein ligase E3D-like [Branchiostoma belcheri]